MEQVEQQAQARVQEITPQQVTAAVMTRTEQLMAEQVAQLVLACAQFRAEAEVLREQVKILTLPLTPA